MKKKSLIMVLIFTLCYVLVSGDSYTGLVIFNGNYPGNRFDIPQSIPIAYYSSTYIDISVESSDSLVAEIVDESGNVVTIFDVISDGEVYRYSLPLQLHRVD